MGGLGGDQVINRVDRRGEEDGVAALASLVTQGDGKVSLSEADASNENGIGFFVEETQPKEMLNLGPVDLFWPAPVELVQGLDHWETSGVDSPLQGAFFASGTFAF